ncbi:MAG: alpha/beta fold hydrolase [Candidatus Hermodarchaeota archaeon]
MPFITNDQFKIFFYENKLAGTPLVFIHGWLGSSKEWIHQLCYFNFKKRIIILDLPGFGKSNKLKAKYSIEFFSKQVLSFLKLLGYNEAILIGHSLGGMIALNIALHNPKFVKKLILISTSSAISQSLKDKFKLILVNLIFKLVYKKFLKSIVKQILSPEFKNRELRKLYTNALKIPKSIVLRTFKNMTFKFNINNQLSQISQPTLIIYGNEDKIISHSMINELGNLIPISEIVSIENSSHRVMVDNYETVNRLIHDFIKK